MVEKCWHFIPRPLRKIFIPKVKQRKYNYVLSVGGSCLTAIVLKEFGLRRFSGPFDWISGGDLKRRLEFVLNGFNGFLEKKDLEISSILIDTKVGSYSTNNIRNGLYLPHDFTSVNLDVSYPIVAEKYERRIKKFLRVMEKSSILMVYCSKEDEEISDEYLDEMLRNILEKYQANRIDMLIVCESSGNKVFSNLSRVNASSDVLRVGVPSEKLGSKGWFYSNYKLHAEIAQWVNTICKL